jgi:hypothetical protein
MVRDRWMDPRVCGRENMVKKEKKRPDDTKEVLEAVGKGATSAVRLQGKILKKVWANTIGALWSRFFNATVTGKIFALVGLCGCIGAAVLAWMFAMDVSIQHREYIAVTSSVANVRESISKKSEVVARVKRGDELTQKGDSEGWWFVDGEGFAKPGWISKSVTRKEEKLMFSLNYEMRGFGAAFMGFFVLFYVGLCLRKR